MPVTHHVESFRFSVSVEPVVPNPNDLHVEFDIEKVKTSDKGPFKSAKTDGKKITLVKQTKLKAGQSAVVEFEADGEYKIVKWQWSVDGELSGLEHEGPPKANV